ncbi:MAG TPA: glycogen debranching N-terminal domain-containing protein, partial [Thermoanaerobaculia bacterium]|nr:glycogen debranching N-terminal domain-containing protein [Thermoanaerobaculia bacterium]
MLVRIRARPDTLYLSHSRTVMAMDREGLILPGSPHGLFVHETRLIKTLRYFINDEAPQPNVLSNIEQDSWLGYYLVAAPGVDIGPQDHGSGMVPPESRQPLELRITRRASEGMHEDADLTNYAREATRFTLSIEIEHDCSDIADLDRAVEIDRRVDVGFSRAPRFEGNFAKFDIALEAGETWHLGIDFVPVIDGNVRRASARRGQAEARPTLSVDATLRQAAYDLHALRLHDLDTPHGWTMAAGLPQYVALFGRDTLTASWQAAMLGPEMMRGTLEVLARYQGTTEDDWRDEQPGRMLHEAHTGPLSALNIINRGRSYGSITTSGLYAFITAELWHWTGDRDAVQPFLEPALRALDWLDRERRHYGLYTYQTRSSDGVKHQAWKDSPDAIVDEHGNQVEPPIATCEEQGFVFIAKLHLGETLWALGMRDEAERLLADALQLQQRFNEAFWMPDLGYYALALDADGNQVRSIASNAGHCIATGIAADAHVPLVAERMFQDDLFSGWGIRTLSSSHPSFNPYSYHLGSVWPVEQGTFALGFMRYGLHEYTQRIAKAQFEAASLFDFHRLPELFSGHQRDDGHPFPALYPKACSPQAWSASTVFAHVQAMLGLYPYAPMNLLIVDPHLPEWLPEYTLRDLRVGDARVTIHFEGTKWRVLEK